MNKTDFPDTFERHSLLVRAMIKLGLICFLVGGALLMRDLLMDDKVSQHADPGKVIARVN